MAKLEETLKDSGHIHKWVQHPDRASYKCIASYNGRACIKIAVSNEELQRRIEEYNNYYELCQSTQAKLDYEEMRLASKAKDRVWMDKILARVEQRCTVKEGYQGMVDEGKYQFNEDEYLPKPHYPDPMSPYHYYITI